MSLPQENFQTKEIPEQLVERVKKWLGEAGTAYFKKLKEDHGEIACVIPGVIPHAVHFNEGMQVRNFMRGTGYCQDWNDHDFDNNWVAVVEKAIGEENETN